MANLNDILTGLIDTDEGIIGKIKNRFQRIENRLDVEFQEIKNNIQQDIIILEQKVEQGSGSSSILDVTAPNVSGNGTLKSDPLASDQKCYSYTSDGATEQLICSVPFSNMKFGHYALCVRAKTNAIGSNDLVKVEVKTSDAVIHSVNFTGDQFGTNSGYSYLYTTFEYNAVSSEPKKLIFNLYSLPVSGVTISFDYAFMNMIMPSIYM